MANVIRTRISSAEDRSQMKALLDFVLSKRPANDRKFAWADGKARMDYYASHIPAHMQSRTQAMGWPNLTVKAAASRCKFESFGYKDPWGLTEIVDANHYRHEMTMLMDDKLITGSGFQLVGHGDTSRGEPEQVVTTENPNNVAIVYDRKLRRATSGIVIRDVEGGFEGEFYTNELIVPFIYKDGTITELEGWSEHGYTRPPIVAFPHQAASNRGIAGHSVITPTIIDLTQAMMEIQLGGRVLRELYSLPGLVVLGGNKSQFVDPNTGKQTGAFSAMMDGFTVIGNHVIKDEKTGQPLQVTQPSIHQLQTGDPGAFLTWAEHLTVRWAVEAAVPLHAAGVQTTNPSSADAIRLAEREGIKRGEDTIEETKVGTDQVGWLIAKGLNGADFDNSWRPRSIFREPSTPTRAASADEVVKYVSAGIMRPDSKVVMRRINLSIEEQEQLEEENTYATQMQLSNMLAAVPETPALAPTFGTNLAESTESKEAI